MNMKQVFVGTMLRLEAETAEENAALFSVINGISVGSLSRVAPVVVKRHYTPRKTNSEAGTAGRYKASDGTMWKSSASRGGHERWLTMIAKNGPQGGRSNSVPVAVTPPVPEPLAWQGQVPGQSTSTSGIPGQIGSM